MIRCIAHNICSPLGWNSKENFRALLAGESPLCRYEGKWGLPDAFMASLFPDGAIEEQFEQLQPDYPESLSRFEKLAILSISKALECAAEKGEAIDIRSGEVLIILSSTKGNIGMLENGEEEPSAAAEEVALGVSAGRIARFLGNPNSPIVVSNACTSGVSAQITAMRLLEAGHYRYAVLCGADLQSAFIVSGFSSFKALSPEECRPFDAQRCGLNLGEGAATMLLERIEGGSGWIAEGGFVRNDANHISGPSRDAEGSFNALKGLITTGGDDLSFISLHGTATLYNDQMESIALRRAGLDSLPAGSLKGWFGHTMGASGVIETIISMLAVENGIVLPTRGFSRLGVSGPANISSSVRRSNKKSFIKLLSGFGGCNAAIRWRLCSAAAESGVKRPKGVKALHRVHITPEFAEVDSCRLELSSRGDALIEEIYRSRKMGYPKFHKMDSLCKLGFAATELLLERAEGEAPRVLGESCSVAFAGRTGSLANDLKYLQSITPENYFPSPALFVYTLPNIVTGEIAIRNGIKGESNFFLLERKDWMQVERIMGSLLQDNKTERIIGGWLDYLDGEHFEADIYFYKEL